MFSLTDRCLFFLIALYVMNLLVFTMITLLQLNTFCSNSVELSGEVTSCRFKLTRCGSVPAGLQPYALLKWFKSGRDTGFLLSHHLNVGLSDLRQISGGLVSVFVMWAWGWSPAETERTCKSVNSWFKISSWQPCSPECFSFSQGRIIQQEIRRRSEGAEVLQYNTSFS